MSDLAPRTRAGTRVRIALDAFEADPQFFRVNVLLYAVDDPQVHAVLAEMLMSAKQALVGDFDAAGVADPPAAATITWSLLSTLGAGVVSYGRGFAQARGVADAFVALIVAGMAQQCEN
ncbi:hypothetical protein OG225_17465 [Nocardia sp. NBC_01377]|uniref:hypothetical protein n=1 Tax=Nocardia sp. NBC_01377 TaxID=2903595 RepID=UPI0032479A12